MSELETLLRDLPPPTPPGLPPELEAELGRLAPVRTRQPWREVGKITGVSIVYAAALLALVTMRHDCGERPMWWLVAVGAAWFAGFATMLALAMVPARGSMMPRWRIAGIGAVIVGLGFVAGGLILPDTPGTLHPNTCLPLGLATALVPVVLGALVLRRAMVVRARWTAAGLGAAGGSLGGLVLHLHCPIADAWHVGIVHGGVVVVAAALAAWLVPERAGGGNPRAGRTEE